VRAETQQAGPAWISTYHNSYGHTAVAPYSLRARQWHRWWPRLYSWDEIEQGPVESNRYTIHNILHTPLNATIPAKARRPDRSSLVRSRSSRAQIQLPHPLNYAPTIDYALVCVYTFRSQ